MRNHAARRTLVTLVSLGLICACGPSDPLEKARIAQDQNLDFTGSLDALSQLAEERPDDAEVQYRYGLALVASGQAALALWPLRRAAQTPEWELRANFPLASAFLQIGSHDRAIELMDRELERDPDNTYALLLRANARIQSRRNFEGALEDTSRVLEIDPDNTDILPYRALALLNLGRAEESQEIIDRLEAPHRDDTLGLHGSPAHCAINAKFLEEKGELEQAEERYDACLAQFPSDANLLHEATTFFDRRGNPERSLELLRAALEETPEAQSYRMALALRLRTQDREEEARELLLEGTEQPGPIAAAEAWAALASFLQQKDDYEGAIEAYQQVSRLAGADDSLLLRMSDLLAMAGRHDEALKAAGQIRAPAMRSFGLGRAYLASGKLEEALGHYEEGNELWPNNVVARYYTAVTSEQLGDFERAVEHYRYSMRISARQTDAYLRLARLHHAAGRLPAALSTLQFSAGERPFEREAALLELQILATLGRSGEASPRVWRSLGPQPTDRLAGAVALAKGVRQRAGPERAIEVIRGVEGLELGNPSQSGALDYLVQLLVESGKAEEALAEVEGALASQPNEPIFHALRGRALAALGRAEPAREAFQRALAEDAEQRDALVGLAGLERSAANHEAARDHYQRALELDASDAEAVRGLAASLIELDQRQEAEDRLAGLLRETPYDREAAMALAELRLQRGAADDRTRELAERALSFGGGEAAESLLVRAGGTPPEKTDAKTPEPAPAEAGTPGEAPAPETVGGEAEQSPPAETAGG